MASFMAVLLTIVVSSIVFAQEKSPWAHESEAAIVQVGGNVSSESYSAKQKTGYKIDVNSAVLSARYLQTRAAGEETAKQWDVTLRYERELSDLWSAFAQHGAESDVYSGYIQRDNSDIGGKYFFKKSDEQNAFSEAGFRYTKALDATRTESYTTYGRVYLEYFQKLNASVSAKFWVEYLPNFKAKMEDAYLVNYEPSLSVVMSEIFSIKVSYLVKYQNAPTNPTDKKETTTFTTALVAKF